MTTTLGAGRLQAARRVARGLAPALGLALAGAAVGCASSQAAGTGSSVSESLSDSSGWFSDSASSPFESSSASSGGQETAWRGDVESLTVAFVRSGAAGPELAAGLSGELGRLARAHGLVDWEAVDATWLALGAGLRRAGLAEDEALALAGRLAGEVGGAEALLREGWRSADRRPS